MQLFPFCIVNVVLGLSPYYPYFSGLLKGLGAPTNIKVGNLCHIWFILKHTEFWMVNSDQLGFDKHAYIYTHTHIYINIYICHDRQNRLIFQSETPQIARFTGPTWGPPGSCRPQVGPCLPHRPCYQGHSALSVLSCPASLLSIHEHLKNSIQ